MARGGLALLLVLVAAVAIAGAAAIDGVTARPSGGAVGRGRGVGAHRGGGGGFVSGDTLWTMKRTQFGQDQTPWSDVLGRESPKFLVTRKLELPTADVVQESLQTQKPFKIMFSFANDQFTTPWLTISDGHGRVLNSVVFTFTYAGDKVVGLRWRLDYNDGDHHGKVLPKLIVVYAWEEQRALDATIAVNGLFLASILVSAGLVAYMMTKGDQTQAYLHAMRTRTFVRTSAGGAGHEAWARSSPTGPVLYHDE